MIGLVALMLLLLFVVAGQVMLTLVNTKLVADRLELDARRRWERFEWRDSEGRAQEGSRRVKLRPARERFAAYRPEWSDEEAGSSGPYDDYEPGQWR